MQFREHPDFDNSDANEWIELDNGTEPLDACAAPYADMIQVYRDNQQYIEERALTTIKRHLGEETLATKPYVLRNIVLFAPYSNHGFQIYFQFYFLEQTEHAPAESDYWWAIINCSYVFDERFGPDRKRFWGVTNLGWTVE